MTIRNRRWLASSAVLIVGLSALTLTGCATQSSGPESIVQSYLEAVQSGNADRAVEIINPGVSKEQRSLLTSEALKAAGKIENIVVLSAEEESSSEATREPVSAQHREISARYDVNGKTVEAQFSADMTEDGWVVTSGYQQLRLPSRLLTTEFIVNGMAINTASLGSYELPVFPGTYKVELAPNKYLSAKPVKVVVDSNNAGPEFKYQIFDAVKAEFDTYFTSFLATCLEAQVSARDESCPNWFDTGVDEDPTNVKWVPEQLPEYEIDFDEGNVIAKPTGRMSHRVTYDYIGPGSLRPAASADEYVPSEIVVVIRASDGVLEFAPDNIQPRPLPSFLESWI